MNLSSFALSCLTVLLVAPFAWAGVPIVLDTDIGGDIDDSLALALALEHPDIDLEGVTTVHGDAHTRAKIVCRWLAALGKGDIPVASASPGRAVPDFSGQMQYGLRPCFRVRPSKTRAVEFLHEQIQRHPHKLTIVAVGPLTNIAELFAKYPKDVKLLRRLIVMGGSIRVGYSGKPPAEPEYNLKTDIDAARAVFRSGANITLAPLDATATLELSGESLAKIFGTNSTTANQLRSLYDLWDKRTPILFDPVAVALAFDDRWFTMKELRIEVDGKGTTRVRQGEPNCRVAVATDKPKFVKWYADRVSKMAQKPIPFRVLNESRPVERGRFPKRVHVCENYETDIERRWWLAGRLETKEIPAGSRRACRGVLCNDFDGKMGDPKALYKAVIFNPVPGPPMGPKTRLSFRCRLEKVGDLRVQIYSLSKGYHRCLTLTSLPLGRWLDLTVDLTRARRPDGSGGPLSEDERIDDIQFYASPDAELLVDDIVLFDAGDKAEKRAFPKQVLSTGWFDTGRQGREWPGDFEIVRNEKPRTWKSAKSVLQPNDKRPWLRVSLRGSRGVPKVCSVRFRYRLTGAKAIRVELVDSKTDRRVEKTLGEVQQDTWGEATLRFDMSKGPTSIDKVRFRIASGELLIDDLLVYEEGE